MQSKDKLFCPTAWAAAYGWRPKFVRGKHSHLWSNTGWGNICSFWLETLCQGQKNCEANFCFLRKNGCFFQSKGEKTVFARETNVLPEFFCPRHNVFQTGGYIFLGFHPLTYLPTISHYILMGSVSYCSCRFCIISWPIGRPPQSGGVVKGGQSPPWLRS